METVHLRSAPIIVTATMGAADAAWTDGLRRRYYPLERNQLPAHITLFRHLPPSVERELKGMLAALCRTSLPQAWIDDVISLGSGVALAVRSPELLSVRDEIAEQFDGALTPQDRGGQRLHITIQNKVPAAVARATLAELGAVAGPRPLMIKGLACWHYRGGPWSPIAAYSFRG